MNRTEIQNNADEINIKEIIRIVFQYKYMIMSFVMIFTFSSAYFAYFKPNVFKASTTIEVGSKKSAGNDILNMAMNTEKMNSATEIEIITSRFLREKALKKVNFTHFYYFTKKFKEIELYKDSPFEVGMLKGYDISFNYYPIDETTYRLVVEEAISSDGKIWNYDEVHSYGTEIITEYFHLNIVKTKDAKESQYRFVIKKNPALAGGISVRRRAKYSTILEISYTDNVPLRAKEYANALAQAYIEQNIERKTREATRKLDFIDKQLKSIMANLKSSAIKVEEFKKNAKTVDLSSKANIVITRIAEYEGQLSVISIDEEMLNSVYKQVKSGKNLESISILAVGIAESSVSRIVKELQNAMMKKRILREDYTEMYPEVIKLTKMIKQLKKTIVLTVKNMRKSVQDKKMLIEKAIKEQQKLLNTLPADERIFGQLQRKFVVNEKIYSYLLEKRLETAVVKASTVSKNRILDSATTPYVAIAPKRKVIVISGFIMGLILGLLLAFLRGFLDNRIKSEDDILLKISVPILGQIPNIKGDASNIKVFSSPKSAVAEAFRNIRTNLQFMTNKSETHTMAITSTVGEEGKTTICINLAAIMSMSGKKTVILNLDMRKPTLHQRFGLLNIYGMSNLLSGYVSLKEVIQNTQYENLDIISSGPIPPNPSELIQTEFMEKILNKLKELYDIIIIDTPPVGLVTDARTLMHYADTTLYIVRADYSKKDFLRNIKDLSLRDDVKGLSILLNDVNMNRGGYGYGYGYGYYEEDKK